MRLSLFALGAALVLTTIVGCGQEKSVVSGVVTLDGVPLDNGTIQFFPEKGDGQTAAAILDQEGRYRVEASPTTMKVVISSSKVIGKRKKYTDVPESPWIEERMEVLPPRYRDRNKTELIFKVEPGENRKDFELKSDGGKRG
jgi:hypothetical protein